MLREISLHGYFGFFFFFMSNFHLSQFEVYVFVQWYYLFANYWYGPENDEASTNKWISKLLLSIYLSIYIYIYIYIWSVWPFVDILIFCHITFGSPTILHIIFYEFIYYVKMRVLNWLLLSNMEKVFFFFSQLLLNNIESFKPTNT